MIYMFRIWMEKKDYISTITFDELFDIYMVVRSEESLPTAWKLALERVMAIYPSHTPIRVEIMKERTHLVLAEKEGVWGKLKERKNDDKKA